MKYTRKNANIRPFEAGGEVSLEHFASKADCGLFALATHSKKRPHCLTLGRMYDGRLYDLCEFGVERYRSLQDFAANAKAVQAGNKVSTCLPLPASQACQHPTDSSVPFQLHLFGSSAVLNPKVMPCDTQHCSNLSSTHLLARGVQPCFVFAGQHF